eukprot:Pgem_evm1s1774
MSRDDISPPMDMSLSKGRQIICYRSCRFYWNWRYLVIDPDRDQLIPNGPCER